MAPTGPDLEGIGGQHLGQDFPPAEHPGEDPNQRLAREGDVDRLMPVVGAHAQEVRRQDDGLLLLLSDSHRQRVRGQPVGEGGDGVDVLRVSAQPSRLRRGRVGAGSEADRPGCSG
jgi:hypothetical protein